MLRHYEPTDRQAASSLGSIQRYGYESITYVPPDYFADHDQGGDLFSLENPAAFIPADILDCPDPKARVVRAARRLGISGEHVSDDMVDLLGALPRGLSSICYLVNSGGETYARPVSRLVPTTTFDQAAVFFLQHPDVIHASLTSYHRMNAAISKEPVSSAAMTTALKVGLITNPSPAYVDRQRAIFGQMSLPRFGREGVEDDPGVQREIHRTFDALCDLGGLLGKEIYAEDDIALIAIQRSSGGTT